MWWTKDLVLVKFLEEKTKRTMYNGKTKYMYGRLSSATKSDGDNYLRRGVLKINASAATLVARSSPSCTIERTHSRASQRTTARTNHPPNHSTNQLIRNERMDQRTSWLVSWFGGHTGQRQQLQRGHGRARPCSQKSGRTGIKMRSTTATRSINLST